MCEALEEFGDVTGHAKGDCLVNTVSFNGEANVFLGRHVNFDNITGVLKGVDEMLGVGLSVILATKIVDYEGESCISNGMDEETGNCRALDVPGGSEVRDEFGLSEKASLFEAVHAFVDFVEDEIVVNILVEVVFDHAVVGDEFNVDADVFRAV
jgi:hypothetical protein